MPNKSDKIIQPLVRWGRLPPAFWGYAVALVLVIVAAGVAEIIEYRWHSSPLVSVFLCAIIASAWLGGYGPGLAAVGFSALLFTYYFLPPTHTWWLHPNEVPRLIFFVGSGLLVAGVSAAQRNATESLRRTRDELASNLQELKDLNAALRAENAERRSAENALRRVETYLSEGQRLSHTGSWAWDVKRRENVFWSKEHFRIFGFDPEKFDRSYLNARERIHPDDGPRFDAMLEQAMRERRDFEMEIRIVLPGGGIRHIHTLGHPVLDESNNLVEYIGTAMDVTEQYEARTALEQAFGRLKQSEDQLRTIIDAIPTLAWSAAADGSMEFVNQRWRNYTGLSAEAARGWGWMSALHADDADWMRDHWRSVVASAKPAELEARLCRFDGEPRWFLFRADPVLDAEGKATKWYGTNTDIDDRKKAEEALRMAQAELAHVTRVMTMGELAASIAHEVNQPLTAVINNANACLDLVPAATPAQREVRAALGDIIDDADRASAVLARVRQLARKAPFERVPLDLREVIIDVLALARFESARRQVAIEMNVARDLSVVLGDRVQLQQVLLNLIVNGMDAMNSIEASKRVLTLSGQGGTPPGRPEVRVGVRDLGHGFKPGQMERLFQPFYSTKPQGMGMGLAISHSIIEAHGGRLWAESNPGPGATFWFSLPAATTDPA